MHRCRNPLHCVVPPYMLDSVARRGTESQRNWALRTRATDQTFRQARAVATAERGRKGPREGVDAVAARAPGRRNRIIWNARNGWEVSGIPRVRDEDDGPTGDPAVDEAFDGFGDTYEFWDEVFSRDSITSSCRCAAWCTSARSTRTRSGTAAGWRSATATGRSSSASRSRST
jgi:Zn-dependent metalloprotease